MIKIFLATIALTLLLGCEDRFKPVSNEDTGDAFVLDTWTGDLSRLDIPKGAPLPTETKKHSAIMTGANLSVSTKHRNGYLLFRARFEEQKTDIDLNETEDILVRNDEEAKKWREDFVEKIRTGYVQLQFEDTDGFLVADYTIDKSVPVTRIIGAPMVGVEGKLGLSSELYAEIGSVDVIWHFKDDD